MECLRLMLVCCIAFYSNVRGSQIVEPLLMGPRHFWTLAQTEETGPVISSYHVHSRVTSRFVSTTVLVEVENSAEESHEASFDFELTPRAFISGFMMTVNGVPHIAKVEERGAAQNSYYETQIIGKSAAHLRQIDDASSSFSVDLNLDAQTRVGFNLTYQELLRRDKGVFKHRVNIAPGQVVDDFRVEVTVDESQGLELMESSWRSPNSASLTSVVSHNPPTETASVLFNPSGAAQMGASSTAIRGALEVTYDVHHGFNAEDLVVENRCFVHYISPEGLSPAGKKVIFVLDVSGSMTGDKIEQMKSAMYMILGQLREIDTFNVLSYSFRVRSWEDNVVPATAANKRSAIAFVSGLSPYGGTNIYGSLIAASKQFSDTDEIFSQIIFLTDGRATYGRTTISDEIAAAVTGSLQGRVSLFSIGFGSDVDDELLEQLASQNQGIYRKVLADEMAVEQLSNFFDEVSTPLLFDITVRYLDGAVDPNSLTQTKFGSYFEGKELVVAGRIADSYTGDTLVGLVEGKGSPGVSLRVSEEIGQVDQTNDVCRLWAILTVKGYIRKGARSTLRAVKAAYEQKALDLSLEYSLVTPFTSLILPTSLAPLVGQPAVFPTADVRVIPTRRPLPPSPLTGPTEAGRDPHFIIGMPSGNITICFDLQALPGTFLNLVSDPVLAIDVNAEIIEVEKSAPVTSHPNPSYMGSIGVRLNHYRILITPENVLVDFEIKMPWGTRNTVLIGKYNLTVHDGHTMTIAVGDNIQMKVSMHSPFKNHPAFFDLTIETADGFSNEVHGLIGQFQHKKIVLKNPHRRMSLNGHVQGVMEIEGKDEYVYKTTKTVTKARECWWSNPETYIDGDVTDYFVPGYFYQLTKIN